MAWTAPRTWVAAEAPSAATMNTHIRDNLAATEAGVLTTEGDLVYASAANTLARLAAGSEGDYLTVASSLPSWAAAAAGHPFHSHHTALTDDTSPGSSGWEQWGSEEAAVDDPGCNIHAFGFLNGVSTSTTLTDVRFKLSLSIDGGSTWSDSDYTQNRVDPETTQDRARRPPASVTAAWVDQNPTGQIQLRGYFYSTTVNNDFYSGHLVLLVVEVAA